MKYRYLNEVLLDWNSEEDLQDNSIIKSSDIKKKIEQCFIYRVDDKPSRIKIFDDGTNGGWPKYRTYKHKVYINDEHVELKRGETVKKFAPGEYIVYIEDIDQVKNTECMFYKCHQLVKAYIPNSVTAIDQWAFSGCSGLISINIPNTVTSIGEGAFGNCSGLTSVTIPNSVSSIGSSAFYRCTSLTNITIPNSVTSIGYYAFKNCNRLTSVIIGNSVTYIRDRTFWHCTGLTNITIPNSVTSIGSYAFQYCSGLKEIYIPKSVKKIYCYAFKDCTNLKTIYVEDINRYKRSIGKNTDPVNWNDAKLIELKK